jgi:DNA-binding MarR family transcriptional regulator
LSESGVTVAEWVILREMYDSNDSTSPSKIAALTGLTRGAVSKLIDRLLHKGLLTRTASSGDRRYQDIQLTSDAITLVPTLTNIADKHDDSFFSPLSQVEKKTLMDILTKLSAAHRLTINPVE